MDSTADILQAPWLRTCEDTLREYFDLSADAVLLDSPTRLPALTPIIADHFRSVNLEWHLIPSARVVPFDNRYCRRLYPTARTSFHSGLSDGHTVRDRLALGHRMHQGRIVAVESTMKPGYLPDIQQIYGSKYGFETDADPLIRYLDHTSFGGTSRYGHKFLALGGFVEALTEEWRRLALLPHGYRVTLCPPVLFNLIGTLFHPEWSQTASLEIGCYWESPGSARCYAVGPNGDGDFSYVRAIETGFDWRLLGFRIAVVPEG
jgi:hypothetical protein